MFNFKHVQPTSFSTPNLVRLDSFRTAATPTKGFVFKPLFTPPKQSAGWKNIESVTGKKFTSYADAVKYVNDLQNGQGGGKSSGGFVGNLFNDVVTAVPGLFTGLYQAGKGTLQDAYATTHGDFSFKHDLAIGKNIVSSYKQMYSPLLHGNLSQFWDNVYNNPLGPILDAASFLTLGAGAAVKGASLVAKGSKLAKLGVEQPLLARSAEAIRTGEKATPENALLHRMTSTNPVIRAREKATFKMTNNLPRGYGAKIEERRFTARQVKINTHMTKGRELGIAPGHHVPAAIGYQKAVRGKNIFQKHLTPHQLAAGHILGILGTHMSVEDAIRNGARIAAEHKFDVPSDVMNLWTHPKTTEALTQALHDFHAGKENRILTFKNMTDQMGQIDSVDKGLHPDTVETAKWGALADLSSDHVVKDYVDTVVSAKNPAVLADQYKGQLQSAKINVTTRLYMAAKNEGVTMRQFIQTHGNDPHVVDSIYRPVAPEAVAKGARINDAPVVKVATRPGDINPIYVPHKSNEVIPHTLNSVPRGQGDMVKENHHVMLAAGRIAIGEDLLGPERARTLRIAHANDIYEAHIKGAVKVDTAEVAQMVASGYRLVKAPKSGRDFMTETQGHYVDKILTQTDEKSRLNSVRDMFTSSTKEDPTLLHGDVGLAMSGDKYLMIREATSKHLAQEYVASSKIIKQYVDKPLNLWKYVVLGLSPRNIVTNVVGNTMMAAVMANGPLGAMRIIAHSAMKTVSSEKVTAAMSLRGVMGISDHFMQRLFPEHWQASFTHGELNLSGKAQSLAFAYRASHRNEIALRQGMFMELIRSDPVIRDIMKRSHHHGNSRNAWESAAEEAFRKHPMLRNDFSDRVDDALGNYRDFSHTEQNIRKVMPFYSWYRHASRTGHALTKRPTTLNAGYNIGMQGAAENKSVFGDVPEFMRSFVPLGKNSDGTVQSLNTSGLNPFNALTDMASGVKNLAVSKDKQGATGKIATFLNPILASSIEELQGTSLLTGAPSKAPDFGQPNNFLANVGARVIGGTPQARLAGAYNDTTSGPSTGLDQLTATGQLKKTKVPTLSKGIRTQAYNFAGFPTKDVNVKAAQDWQKTLEQSNTYHLPKPGKKKAKKYTLGAINFGGK